MASKFIFKRTLISGVYGVWIRSKNFHIGYVQPGNGRGWRCRLFNGSWMDDVNYSTRLAAAEALRRHPSNNPAEPL